MTETENQILLDHQHIIKIIDFNKEGKWTQGSYTSHCIYAIYEVALGGELFGFVALGPLPEKIIRLYFKQMMSAIEYMHSQGVYHRDLKLENILLNEELSLMIADFGLSINKNKLKDQKANEYVGSPP